MESRRSSTASLSSNASSEVFPIARSNFVTIRKPRRVTDVYVPAARNKGRRSFIPVYTASNDSRRQSVANARQFKAVVPPTDVNKGADSTKKADFQDEAPVDEKRSADVSDIEASFNRLAIRKPRRVSELLIPQNNIGQNSDTTRRRRVLPDNGRRSLIPVLITKNTGFRRSMASGGSQSIGNLGSHDATGSSTKKPFNLNGNMQKIAEESESVGNQEPGLKGDVKKTT